jgi:hypothetical protein
MRYVANILVAIIAFGVGLQPAFPQTALQEAPAPRDATAKTKPSTEEVLTDAAIIAILIAASIASYKAMGKPCSCPEDVARNGSRCGGRSAWSKPGGFTPLCYPADVTADMIKAYRATKAIPSLK